MDALPTEMKTTILKRLSPKARGELAEARFIAKALELGIAISRPFGESSKFDFICEAGGHISRVQVKSAWMRAQKGYQVMAGPGCPPSSASARRRYRRDEIDFLVAYIAPEDTWYVFPIAAITHTYIRWNTRSAPRLARYREAWHLLFDWDITPTARVSRPDGSP